MHEECVELPAFTYSLVREAGVIVLASYGTDHLGQATCRLVQHTGLIHDSVQRNCEKNDNASACKYDHIESLCLPFILGLVFTCVLITTYGFRAKLEKLK